MELTEMWTAKEVGHYLRVTLFTVYNLANAHVIPCFKIGGAWRFPKEMVEEWVEDEAYRRPCIGRPFKRKATSSASSA